MGGIKQNIQQKKCDRCPTVTDKKKMYSGYDKWTGAADVCRSCAMLNPWNSLISPDNRILLKRPGDGGYWDGQQ